MIKPELRCVSLIIMAKYVSYIVTLIHIVVLVMKNKSSRVRAIDAISLELLFIAYLYYYFFK